MQYGFHAPLLEPVSAALFVLGGGWVLARLRERRAQMLVLWTLLPLIAGAALTIDTPFYPRISGLVPFAVLLIAIALHALLDAVARGGAGRAPAASWPAPLAVGAVTLIAADNLRSYFVDYAPRSIAIRRASRSPPGFARHGAGKTTYMVGSAPGFFIRHGAITFLTYGYDDARHRRLRGDSWHAGARSGARACSSSCRRARPLIPRTRARRSVPLDAADAPRSRRRASPSSPPFRSRGTDPSATIRAR